MESWHFGQHILPRGRRLLVGLLRQRLAIGRRRYRCRMRSVGAVAHQGSVAVGVSDQAVRITMEGGVELVGGVERRLEGREEEGGEGGLEHV